MPLPSLPTAGPMSPTSETFEVSPEIAFLTNAVHSRLSSLVDSLASRTPSPASATPAPTSATSGTNASECFGIYDPSSRCSRTSQACLPLSQELFSTEFLATWPRSGTLARGKLYQRQTLAHLIDGIGFGSSASMNWPTATAADDRTDNYKSSQQSDGSMHSVTLPQAVNRNWPTARSQDGKHGEPTEWELTTDHAGTRNSLRVAVQRDWPTAASRDYKGESGAGRQERKGHPADTLPNAIALAESSGPPPTASGPLGPDSRSTNGSRQESWPSPRASDGSKATRTPEGAAQEVSRNKGPDLGAVVVANQGRAESWATPTGDDANNATRESGAFQSLTRQVATSEDWPTPSASGETGGPTGLEGGSGNRQKLKDLGHSEMTAGKLNPSWVETLMGLPIGWTQLPHKFTKPKKGTP
jgi:hypothetical protein